MHPIESKERDHDKSAGSTVEDKPALVLVALPGGSRVTLDATHHIINGDTVSVYLGARSDGIDIQTDLSRCVIARGEAACDALGTNITGDTDTDEDADTGTHADENTVVVDGGRDVTIVEGQPNAVAIGLMFDGEDWCVSFGDLTDWSQKDLEPWLANRLDAPDTVAEARDDDRVFVPDEENVPARMRDVSFSDSVLARGEYNAESGTWIVDLVVADNDTGEDDNPELVTDGGRTIGSLPFNYSPMMDGDVFIDKRSHSEADTATIAEYDAPRSAGNDVVVSDTGEVLVSAGGLEANSNWAALACEDCSEAFLFFSLDTAPEECPVCGNGGEF
jgi:ribosomal protein S27E